MDKAKWVFRLLAAVLVVASLALWSCDGAGSGGGGGGGGPGDVTFEDGDTWRLVGLGIDDDSTWFSVIDATVDGTNIDVTMTAVSDQDPPSGATQTVTYTEDSDNVVTFNAGSSVGLLNTLGTTFAIHGHDVNDDEGELYVGVRAGSGLGDATASGIYWVAIVRADINYAPVFFTATMDDEIVTPGFFRTSNPVTDQDFTGYITAPDSMAYEIAGNGYYSMPDSPEVYGIVREDGEFFIIGEIYGTPLEPDNDIKTLMFGVQTAGGAAGSLLAGTWDISTSCVGEASTSWYEGAERMTLLSTGSGTLTDNDGTNFPVSVDLNSDGTLTFEFNNEGFDTHGAITPSGDTAVFVYPAEHPGENNYCVSIAIKEP